jgi:transposase-like protein
MRERRTFSREFKLGILKELELRSPAEVSREHEIHPVLLSKWKKDFRENPGKAFSGRGNLWKSEAELENYKRMVAELYAENDFLKKTSAKLQKLNAEQETARCIR